ncbi:PaaI family thioesterase [Pontixanthobacter sp. CEM42]|uniref:PaaI family thioesterase n=1 Tax=Pontixanthobacter sp. CEM42 TaxID=2792077 RepID=UPI001FD813F5|nr:PaaI family thioesterase [Pontixanthobacter sp. CEM42]
MSDFVAQSWPHAELMGAEFVSFDEETSTITMNFTAPESFITPRGSVQGGLVAGFLDETMGWAYTYSTNGEYSPLMLDVNFSLLRPVRQGLLVATGKVIKAGKRVLFLSAELTEPDGTILARATSTCIPTPNPGFTPDLPQ